MATLKRLLGNSIGIAMFLSVGCGVNADRIVKSAKNLPQFNRQLEGTVSLTDGATLDLSSITDRPVVLVFAQDTCLVCIQEAQGFKNVLPDPAVPPQNVELISVVAGADQVLAQEWKTDHSIPWSVGYDYEIKLFSKYCPEKQTPCTLVQLPGHGVVFQKTGLAHADELQAITGEWK